MRQIQQSALASDYAYTRLAHLCNNIGPRLSGSPQAAQAVEYVAQQMRDLGLEVTVEPVPVPHWVRGEERAELVEFPGMAADTTQKVIVTALGGSVATPAEGITAEVVAVKDIAELQALPHQKVAGKIVLFTGRFDDRMAASGFAFEAYGRAVGVRVAGASEAAKMGAVASVIRSVGDANFRLVHTGVMIYADGIAKIPHGAVTAEDAEMIASLVEQGRVRMHLTLTPQTLPDVMSANVIADIKGSEHPEQVVIVSGHLDSWDLGTGAIDDGAGVAAAMQIAQTLAELKLKPKRTIRVVAWMSEENSGNGATTYVKDYAADIANHVAAIELDSGAGHALGFTAHADPKMLQALAPMSAVLESQGAGILRHVDEAPGADIAGLDEKGVSTFGVLNDARLYFHHHHTPADTFDKVKKDELQENAAVMAVGAWMLANATF